MLTKYVVILGWVDESNYYKDVCVVTETRESAARWIIENWKAYLNYDVNTILMQSPYFYDVCTVDLDGIATQTGKNFSIHEKEYIGANHA